MNILRNSVKPPTLTSLVILLGLMGCSGGSGTSNPTDPAEPVFGLDRFGTGSATVDNRWFPLVPGTTNILEGQNEEGDIETVVITVSHEIREINGISSAIVIDREYEDGELVEETFDWYAQDLEGHVWYMGEASTEFDDGVAVGTGGSWESGVDVEGNGQLGQAGIIMKASPVVGDTYQHEIYPGVAEDAAEVVDLSASFTYMDGRMVSALKIRDTDPLEPDGNPEFKYYVSSTGLIAEENADGSERIELINSADQRSPEILAENFTQSLTIDNQWLPLSVGAVRNYSLETDDGIETVLVEVLDETREIMGITARVVRDRVFLDGVIIEDTHDWFAQDNQGNVWYFGEEVSNYEYDDSGTLIEINNDSAWEAGVDGGQPGIIMLADPRVGDSYRQEYSPGEAEDLGSVVGIGVDVVLSDGAAYSTLKIRDWNPLEPDSGDEFKYYAAGIGLVLEEEDDGEEVLELINQGI